MSDQRADERLSRRAIRDRLRAQAPHEQTPAEDADQPAPGPQPGAEPTAPADGPAPSGPHPADDDGATVVIPRRQRRAAWAASVTEEVPIQAGSAHPATEQAGAGQAGVERTGAEQTRPEPPAGSPAYDLPGASRPIAESGHAPSAFTASTPTITHPDPDEFDFPALVDPPNDSHLRVDPVVEAAVDAAVEAPAPEERAPSEAEEAGSDGFDDIISRAVASAGTVTTSSALILPSLPDGEPLVGPLTETGEVIITGSLELPRELGETGGHARRHDTIDSGRFFDGSDIDVAPDDARPVSAARAISSQASRNAMVTPVTKRGSRLPLILSIVAGGLFVCVIAVVIIGAMSGAF